MTDELWQEIVNAENLELGPRSSRLKNAMEAIAAVITHRPIPRERWLSVAHHMLEAIRRSDDGEQLAAIDDDTAAQIDPNALASSQAILASISAEDDTLRSTPEVVLLAIHIQCANEGF